MREDLKILYGNRSMPITVELAGITYPNPSYLTRRFKSNCFVIEYVTDGEGFVEINNEVFSVGKDTVYLLYEGDKHYYYADEKNPFTKIFMNFCGELGFTLLNSYNLLGKHFFAGNNLKPTFEKILDIIHADIPECQMQSALQGILVEIISSIAQSEAENSHSDEALLLKNYIDSNLSELVLAEELSKCIFRSPDYCIKLFKREFGITPYAYQINRKISISKSLLRESSMSIAEIASFVGYTDSHYFSNLFYEKCGMRPSKYRKIKRLQ